ncbi:chromatin-remodeling complex subunit ies6 [Savitreella phatthalungensis]
MAKRVRLASPQRSEPADEEETASSQNDSGESGSDSDGSDASSIELPEALSLGREKRATAGNRLREMLNAEIASEAHFAEEADDDDFGSDQDKVSDLDSELDSSSSDDEAGPGGIAATEDDDAGERALKEQEKEAKRARKRKAADVLAKAKAKAKAPGAVARRKSTESAAKRRKITPLPQLDPSLKRSSARSHAVKVAGEVTRRLEEAEAARRLREAESSPIPAREHVRALTQEERLAEAKVTEARNIESLNTLVQYEEEKKATQRALAARKRTVEPIVRYISRVAHAPKSIDPASESEPAMSVKADIASKDGPIVSNEIAPAVTDNNNTQSELRIEPAASAEMQTFAAGHVVFEHFPAAPATTDDEADDEDGEEEIDPDSAMAKVRQQKHIDAEKLLLSTRLSGKSLNPRAWLCPITGLPARYHDPRTGVYYRNAAAYKRLQAVIHQDTRPGGEPQIGWCEALQAFVNLVH